VSFVKAARAAALRLRANWRSLGIATAFFFAGLFAATRGFAFDTPSSFRRIAFLM
jgi:hypothetical protein